MNIDMGKIATNAISALVTTVFLGAAFVVWDGVHSIDGTIDDANNAIIDQNISLQATQVTLVTEIADLRNRIKSLENQSLSLTKALSQSSQTRGIIRSDGKSPFILDEFKEAIPNAKLKEDDATRIAKDISSRQKKLSVMNKLK